MKSVYRWLIAVALVCIATVLWAELRMNKNPQDSSSQTNITPKSLVAKQAIGGTSQLPHQEQRAYNPKGFSILGPPGPHDWLANHPEPGQSFDQFSQSKFNRVDKTRPTIYLQPIGRFVAGKSPRLAALRNCAASFFQMPVEVLPSLAIAESLTTRTNPHTHNRQLLATDILDWLKRKIPQDAYCLLGVTMEDLYPESSWNFVFGMASLRERVGVFSFARYDPAFYGEAQHPDTSKILLRRSCKVLTHEAGHMFGMGHCIYYECGMNGSNHLAESDSRQIHLCPVCLRKLQFAIGLNLTKRYQDLASFYQQAGLETEKHWINHRLTHINPP